MPLPIRMARPVRLLNDAFLSPGVNLNSNPRQLPPPDDENGDRVSRLPGLDPCVGGLG